MSQNGTASKNIVAIVGLLVIVAVIAIGVLVTSGKKPATSTATASTTPPTQTTTTPPSTTTTASTYKDGTYSASGSYDNPGGNSTVGVRLTIANGTITDSTVTAEATNPESRDYQQLFVSGYKNQVVGKSLDSVDVGTVSGSSLTSEGFNAAVAKIKSQAKA